MAGFSEVFSGAPVLQELDPNATEDLSSVTYHGFVNVTAKFVGYNNMFVTLYNNLNEVSVCTFTAHSATLYSVTSGRTLPITITS